MITDFSIVILETRRQEVILSKFWGKWLLTKKFIASQAFN